MGQSAEAIARVSESQEAAEGLKDWADLTIDWLRERAASSPILGEHPDLIAYLRAEHAHAPRERLRVLYLTARNMLIRDELLWEGSIDQAPFWPRIVLQRALELNAAALILVHNHPSGEHDPSKMDLQATASLYRSARELEIELYDHLIFSSSGHCSLRQRGLL